jgi:hypothetical protein
MTKAALRSRVVDDDLIDTFAFSVTGGSATGALLPAGIQSGQRAVPRR